MFRKPGELFQRDTRPHVALLVETSLGSGRDILRGIARYVREHQPWSLYHQPRGLEEEVPRWLEEWKGDGIIARIQSPQIARQMLSMGIPVVDVLGAVPETGLPLVHVDDAQIARTAAEHLLERGFRQFAYVGICGETWSQRRQAALLATVRQEGGDLQVFQIPRQSLAADLWDTLGNELARWIAGLPKPTGLMVCSDQCGPQVLEACRRANIHVPDEVAVVGVDNDEPLCEVCNPPLSSIQPGHMQVGYEAAAQLHQLMLGKPRVDRPTLVPPGGVVTRLSTEVLAIEDRQIADVLRKIRERACSGVSVDTLAREVGLSRSVLQRRFRQLLQRSVHHEILSARLKRAMELLSQTELPLADIAERTGFKHQEYMGAVFKAKLKMTPAHYRRLTHH